ncbi:hypothetical protein ACAW68_05880 [Weissella confusa]|uniref:hypothetical protein n=1 Tax=Weissella confusa TaxID=1583 RepID=UPI0035A3C694
MQDVRQSTVTKIELKKAVLLSEQIAQLKEQTAQVFGEHGQLLHIFMQKTHGLTPEQFREQFSKIPTSTGPGNVNWFDVFDESNASLTEIAFIEEFWYRLFLGIACVYHNHNWINYDKFNYDEAYRYRVYLVVKEMVCSTYFEYSEPDPFTLKLLMFSGLAVTLTLTLAHLIHFEPVGDVSNWTFYLAGFIIGIFLIILAITLWVTNRIRLTSTTRLDHQLYAWLGVPPSNITIPLHRASKKKLVVTNITA